MIAKEQSYDYNYYIGLPESSRIELIDGQIYDMAAAPNTIHQEIISFLHREISAYLKGKTCKIFPAPFDVFLGAESKNVRECKNIVQPDISIVCDKNKITRQGCVGAPDFIIEIVSRSSRMMDYAKKLNLYSEYGVKEYWIVDPKKQDIHMYVFNGNELDLKTYSFQDMITSATFSDLVIDFNEFDSDFMTE